MYKLVAIDLDGTMLNRYGIVTEKTKQVIEQVQKNQIEVIIASGRPIDSIKTIAKEIKSENYFISGNGAILYDIKKDEILYENTLKKTKVLDIIKICEENSIFYNIYTEKEILNNIMKMKEKTIINIANKVTDVKNMDKIYLMVDGKFIDSGTHEELLAKDSIYQEMYKYEMAGELVD